jgi:hypothetical protein
MLASLRTKYTLQQRKRAALLKRCSGPIGDIGRQRKPLKPAGAFDFQRVELGKYLIAPVS